MAANKKQKTEVAKDKESDFEGYLSFALFQDSLSGKDTDLTFHVGPASVPIKAHSVVLKRTSVVFDVMLSEPWKRGKEIALPEDDPEDFRLFLKLLYGYKQLAPNAYDDFFAVVSLADKYDSNPVQNVLSRFVTGLVNNNLAVANVVSMYQSAKVYDGKDFKILTHFKEGAKKFIFKNINEMWKRAEWLKLDEDDIIWMLSQDELYHLDYVNVAPGTICNCGKRTCCSSSSNRQRYLSTNEVLILGKAVDWIKHQISDKKKVNAMLVLKHVRFGLISEDDLKGGAFGRLRDTLCNTELSEIVFARYATGSGPSGFVSFGKPRFVPTQTLRSCVYCKKSALCRHKPNVGYLCSSCFDGNRPSTYRRMANVVNDDWGTGRMANVVNDDDDWGTGRMANVVNDDWGM